MAELTGQDTTRYNKQMMMSVWGFVGQVTFLHPPQTPCLRCIVP